MKKLYTLNRQLFDKETKESIGDIESYHPTFDMDEIQSKISNIRYNHYKQGVYDQITKQGNEVWSKDYIYAFTVYGNNHGAHYWIEYHELNLTSSVIHDLDLM